MKHRVTLLAGMLAAGLLAVPTPAQAAPAESVLIAEVLPLGLTVTAIGLHLDDAGELTDPEAAAAAFVVLASGAPRVVVDAYMNTSGERTDTPSAGEWLVLELEPSAAGLSDRYSVEQTATVSLVDGVIHPPASAWEPSDVVTPLIDRYEAREQQGLRYRLFVPEEYDAAESYPLVLTLHGYGESGTDNERQLTANQLSTAFADPVWQKRHPAFIVSPQLEAGTGPGAWSHAEVQATLLTIIESLSAEYPIDSRRVYIAGLSMGALGAWDLLTTAPNTFAGALLVAYGGGPYVEFTDTPLWNIQSIDDDTVPYSTSVDAAAALEDAGAIVTRAEFPGNLSWNHARETALEQWRNADAEGASILFTAFTPGTTGVPGEPPTSGHFSWVDVFSNEVYLEWLFSQSLSAPEAEVASPVRPWALGVFAVVLAATGLVLWRRGRRAGARASLEGSSREG